MSFMRALSVHGLKIGSELTGEDRRERIRVAILTNNLSDKKFVVGPDHRMETYAEAYARCYHRPVEMRRMQRDEMGRPEPSGPAFEIGRVKEAADETLNPADEDDEDEDDDEDDTHPHLVEGD